MGGYNPKKENISYFLGHVSKHLDRTIADYDNILLLGNFNSSMTEEPMKDFCQLHVLENIIKEPTCLKKNSNPTSIDLILANTKCNFQESTAIETGLSDHVYKTYFKKKDTVTIN